MAVERVDKKCSKCHLVWPVSYFADNGQGYLHAKCRDCFRAYHREWSRKKEGLAKRQARANLKHYHAHKNNPTFHAKYMFQKCKGSAACRLLSFSLTQEWVQKKLERGVCEVTGIPFDAIKDGSGKKRPFAASIDRIDNSLGYSPENCRMVVWIFNLAKATWTDVEVKKMAEALWRP